MNGRLLAIGAGVTYGTLGIFGTLFYDEGGDSFTLLAVRFCGGSLIFAAIVLLRGRPRPSPRNMTLAVALGPAQLGATACLFVGFDNASPGLVTLLFYIYPLLVTVAAGALFGEQLGARRAALLGVGMAGIALTVGAPQSASGLGIVCGLGAGVFTAAFILGGRHVMQRGVDAFQFVALAYSGCAVAMLIAALVRGVEGTSGPALTYALLVVILGTAVPTLLFYSAIRSIGAGPAARLATIEPATAVVLSYLVLGDSLTLTQIAGGVLVTASVVALAAEPGTLRRGAALRAAEP